MFWVLTPLEVWNFVEADMERSWDGSWRNEAVARMKKIPPNPAELYKKKRRGMQGASEMKHSLKQFAERTRQANKGK